MTDQFGAPGLGISRREFVAATGGVGTAAIAGCSAPDGGERVTDTTSSTTNTTAQQSDLPTTSPPEVVDATEQGNQVTLKSVPAVHEVHPLETMGGPVEFPQVWAFATEDGDPSVPGPIMDGGGRGHRGHARQHGRAAPPHAALPRHE